MKKAVVLLSGGLDSATTLYYAKAKMRKCHCLIFDYGQRHVKEIGSAKRIAEMARCSFQVLKVRFPWKGSSLLDKGLKIPAGRLKSYKIPSTYVPARNIIFLSFALSCAEAIGAQDIFIGANAIDYSGYPDCRPDFFKAFERVIKTGTKTGSEAAGRRSGIEIKTPLIRKTKKEIVRLAGRLNVPLELTWSCYKGAARPCGVCDSCVIRAKGFREAGMKDPLAQYD